MHTRKTGKLTNKYASVRTCMQTKDTLELCQKGDECITLIPIFTKTSNILARTGFMVVFPFILFQIIYKD